MTTQPTHTPTFPIVINSAARKALAEVGYNEWAIQRIVRAVNAYEPMVEALKRMGATWHNQFCTDAGHESECIAADEAIAKAEGR